MSTTHDLTIPSAIQAWIDTTSDPDRLPALRGSLADDAQFDFAGIRRSGPDAVLAQLASSPRGRLGLVPWRLIDRGQGRYTVRFANEDGTPMPSPGGPMVAMDFDLRLDDEGLISLISPNPIHSEPADLAEPLRPGHVFPAALLPDFTGAAPVQLIDANAIANVVVFTCNACPWARGWHDRLQDLVRDYAPRGVHFVQVNPNDPAISAPDAPELSRQRVAAGEFASPYLHDEGQIVARSVGARHTPDVFVTDGAGGILYHGALDASMEQPELRAQWLRDALDDVLAGASVRRSETDLTGCTIKWTM